ncbi:hypothetical protein EJ02DRAFT_127547 [Clathrospora elynae]|uniref:Osmotin, thaumatin-like protein n=1 Tax=Clathrospora elynae TaxID=706981 RepID=A0A6A5S780_9PLEO|nr:hypothetical protein EJ02DRAFT_127547 [Clathrospora elynae]
MLSKLIFGLAGLQASLILAASNAVVVNRCPYDIWLWSVSPNNFGKPICVPAQTRHTEAYRTVSTSIKISKTNKLVAGKQTQFEYSIIKEQLWFDISFVDCAEGSSADNCPGHDLGLMMTSSEPKCDDVECGPNAYCPKQAFYVDQPLKKLGIPEPVFTCPGAGTGMDLQMIVCSG